MRPSESQAPLPSQSRSQSRSLALVLGALVVAMANSTAPSPLYRLFQTQWGFSATTLTLVYAVYSGGVLMTLLSLGPLSDRLRDRRLLIVPALGVIAAGALCIAAATSVGGLIAGRLLSGLGTGALTGAASAALVELMAPVARKRAALLATTSITAGAALGPALSALALWLHLGPTHLPFILTALAALGVAGGLLRVGWPARTIAATAAPGGVVARPASAMPGATPDAAGDAGTHATDTPHRVHAAGMSADTPHMARAADMTAEDAAAAAVQESTLRPDAAPDREPGLLASCGPAFIVASAALALAWAAGAFAMTLAPTLAERLMGIHDRTVIALLLCALQIVMGITQLSARHAAPRTALVVGTVLVALAVPICALASWWGMAALFCGGTLAIGIGYGAGFVGAAAMVNDIAPAHRRASAVSLFYVVGYGGSALPILAFGALADAFGFLPATALFALASVGVAGAILRVAPRLPAQ
ncbi:MAG: MFS transporter [Janthinobacterium lividum]